MSRASALLTEANSSVETDEIRLVNRDGDLFFIQCPECDSLHLRKIGAKKYIVLKGTEGGDSTRADDKLPAFRCLDCKTEFGVYLEDGLSSAWRDFDKGQDSHGHADYVVGKAQSVRESLGRFNSKESV